MIEREHGLEREDGLDVPTLVEITNDDESYHPSTQAVARAVLDTRVDVADKFERLTERVDALCSDTYEGVANDIAIVFHLKYIEERDRRMQVAQMLRQAHKRALQARELTRLLQDGNDTLTALIGAQRSELAELREMLDTRTRERDELKASLTVRCEAATCGCPDCIARKSS